MADIQIGVNQGDTVYYYDQSIGNIVSRDWLFIGGTPTGGTSYGPSIKYNSANALGYGTSLYVTDAAGVTGIATKNNIIVVYPEIMTAQITATPSSTSMDTTVIYQSIGLTGTGYVSYNWTIPGLGATSGPLLSSISNPYPDWYILTGTYTGLPGSSYTGTATLSVTSNVGNNANTSQNVTFYKYGPSEDINYNTTSPIAYPITGPYYTCTVLGANSTTIGLGGSNIVLEINQNGSYSGQMWNNSFFHSTNEYCNYYPNNDDLGGYIGYSYGIKVFKTIFSGASLTLAGATYAPNPKIDLGNYITTGFINTNLNNKFYITDYPSGGELTDAKFGNREWSNDAVSAYMSNKYYLTTSSKFIENGGFGAGKVPSVNLASVEASANFDASSYKFDGGYGAGGTAHGPCVPSSYFFLNRFGTSNVIVDATIQIGTEAGTIYQFNVTLSDNSDGGNTPDAQLITAQSSIYGPGLISTFNNALASIGSPSKLSDFIGFDAEKYFAAYENGGASINAAKQYDALNFHGIRLYVKDPAVHHTGIPALDGRNISGVRVFWGPNWNSDVAGNGYFTEDRELTSSSGPAGNRAYWNSWLGFNRSFGLPFTMPTKASYLRGWRIGGAV